jgi:phage tail sheath gpL-like
MSTLNIQINTEQVDVNDFRKPGQNRENLLRISRYINAIAAGKKAASVDISSSSTAPVAASHTITVSQAAVTADDTITVLGVTLTAKASGANGTTQFNAITSNAIMATNLAACINANTTLSKYVTATAASEVVTITSNVKGSVGNYLIPSALGTIDSGTPFTISGGFEDGTGGSEGSQISISKT